MKCLKCGAEVDGSKKFCGACGAPVPVIEKPVEPKSCSQCGCVLAEGAGFCGSCGAKVSAPVAPPSEKIEVQIPNEPVKVEAKTPQSQSVEVQSQAPLTQQSEKKGGKVGIVIAIIVLAVAMLFITVLVAGLLLTGGNKTIVDEPVTELVQTDETATEEIYIPEEEDEVIYTLKEDEYLFPSDTEYVTTADLNGKTQEEVRLMLNEIYARHGRIFSNQKYVEYFEAQSWYEPDEYFSESEFNTIEKENIAFIVNYEKQKGWR